MTRRRKSQENDAGRFAYEGLDRVLHEKARLGIMTSLVTRPDGVLFTELKRLCALTDGNLSRHLDVLQEAGLVEAWRGPVWHWVWADGPASLGRVKVVDPSFRNWPALAYAVLKNIVPDFPLCNKSFNLSYSGNDL